MFLPLEEIILSVSAPEVSNYPLSKACPVVFEQNRYFIYAINALVVILLENQDEQIINNPRVESRRNSSFELWQVWHENVQINSVSVNQHQSHRVAKGAIALCLEEGRGVLLMPQTSHGTISSTVSSTDVALEESKRSIRGLGAGGVNNLMGINTTLIEQANEYTRVHLNLHIPTWKETIRWKSEDQYLDKLEWVKSGDDLYLFGCGEKVTLWKIVDDAVQVYFQRAFTVCEPERLQNHQNVLFEVCQSGKFVATNCSFDCLTKVWAIHQLKYDGTPTCLFLPHEKSIKQLLWGKRKHSYKLKEPAATYEMLFCLDRNGTIYIWRENNGSISFSLWKKFNMGVFYPEINDLLLTDELKMKSFGLVNYYWARNMPTGAPTSSNPIIDALLDESNVLSALCNFHYGYSSLEETRNTNFFQQHEDGLAKINSKFLGDRVGTFADTHAGERMIQSNPGLQKSFNLFLLYAILKNGDFVLYKVESTPFSVS
jgi:WD40 repeat protein